MIAILADTSQAASQILNDGIQAQAAIASAMDNLWNEVLGGGLYLALSRLGTFFAVGTLIIFIVQWSESLITGESYKPLADLVFPILVIILLANNGTALAEGTKGLRSVINQTNQTLLSTVSASVSLQEAYKMVTGEIGAQSAIESLASNCQTIADPTAQQTCLTDAAAQAQSLADGMQTPPSGGFSKFVEGIKDPVGAGISAIASTIQLALRGWLIAFGIAFQWVVEISLLLTGLIGPVAVGLSLMPVKSKAIYGWLIGFFSVGMVKIYFNVIAGLVATMVVNAGANDPMIFAFATGLLSPLLAMALAAGGGMAIFNSIPKVAGMVIGRGI
ncbi:MULTISPECIES: hypothetical protein [unclassified Coleofasciculus]|uniref:hypothetical protein n=1 Tax=unclassified Coleofasciculus TaxID=2692782 RepID=UPI00187E539A|nr:MULTISPECIES: hypothetical protein [unclassified Coleofasciculus]MBE9128021.1 hypothetical protein [Coleofasciculus sp. LEGE 07081]MBE9150539.1 hypothetical protein [Coleofasciculus sp. LEGE 07092]